MNEPTGVATDAAASIFNLPDYCVVSVSVLAEGQRQIMSKSTSPRAARRVVSLRHGGRNGAQRIRDIPVAGAVQVLWSKSRWYCDEPVCARLSFSESTTQIPRGARFTGRLRGHVVDVVVRSAGQCPRPPPRSLCPGG